MLRIEFSVWQNRYTFGRISYQLEYWKPSLRDWFQFQDAWFDRWSGCLQGAYDKQALRGPRQPDFLLQHILRDAGLDGGLLDSIMPMSYW